MENIKTGDLVTAYRAGIHRVIAITPRYKAAEYPYVSNKPTDMDSVGEYNPLITYQPVYNKWGEPVKSKTTYHCDVMYCKPAMEYIESAIKDMEDKILVLKQLQETLSQ